MNKYIFYRFLAPFRSHMQIKLRSNRICSDFDAFCGGFERDEIARILWDILRKQAFVADFRPHPDDNLSKIYAMGPEEVRDDLVEPLLAALGISTEGIDFAGFDFSALATPRNIGAFVMNVMAGNK